MSLFPAYADDDCDRNADDSEVTHNDRLLEKDGASLFSHGYSYTSHDVHVTNSMRNVLILLQAPYLYSAFNIE